MSDILKQLRHPSPRDVPLRWRSVAADVNLADSSRISDIPGLPSPKEVAEAGVLSLPAIAVVRQLTGAAAIRCFAKSAECIDALRICSDAGASASAISAAYNAAYFAARSLCLISGFTTGGQDSKLLIDVFAEQGEGSVRSRQVAPEDQMIFYHYGRWGHEEVWSLVRRISATLKPDALTDVYRFALRKMRLDRTAGIRNRYFYSDAVLFPETQAEIADFPDLVPGARLNGGRFRGAQEYASIAFNVLGISAGMISRSGLEEALKQTTSARRRKLVDHFATKN